MEWRIMVVASLPHYLPDRRFSTAVVIVVAALLVVVGLLAFGALHGAGTADGSLVDSRLMAPFRWGPMARLDLG